MNGDFYDKVARKFGVYHTGAEYVQKFPGEAPEDVFKNKLIEISGHNKTALDIGCADGRFTVSMAQNFKKIYGIDLSSGMLASANILKQEQGTKNVEFLKADASKTAFSDSTFDVIYNRRGPDFYGEFFRLLKKGGYYLEIGIAEKDSMEIKKVFGRGQNYGDWNKSTLNSAKKELNNAGFTIIYEGDFVYSEFYKSYADLDKFLQGVPIFEDFDSKKDELFLKEYQKKFQEPEGIRMDRHRFVLLAQK